MAKKVKPEPQATEKSPETKAVARIDEKTQPLAKSSGRKLAGRGFENLEMSDILLPRVKLTQHGSPEVVAETAKQGEILLALSGENFGNKGIMITPIMHFRSRIKWVPRDDGGGIDCSSPDARTPRDPNKYAANCASCSHKDWNNDAKSKKDQQPTCVLYENFLVFIENQTSPVIIPMEKTKAKVAKKFFSMGALKGGDIWNFQYKLGVVKETSANDEPYYNYTISDTGKKTPEDLRKKAEQVWESMLGQTVSETNQTTDDAAAPQETAASGKY